MTAMTRSEAVAIANSIRDATEDDSITPTILGQFLHDLIDSTVFTGEAETPPVAGDGLTGTNTFSVLPNGSTISVGPSGVRIADINGLSVLGRSANSSGAVAAISGSADQVFRINSAGTALGFGTIATAGIADSAVTLAKMANMATDSLLGRDTAGSGAPEVIGLNATLSMTGTGNLQRAALTGAISASAGSNATSYSSTDFSGLSFISQAATPAGAGKIRWGSDVSYSIQGRTSGGADQIVLLWDPATPRISLGTNGTVFSHIYLNTSTGQLRAGSDYALQWSASSILLNGGIDINMVSGSSINMFPLDSAGSGATGGGVTVRGAEATNGAGGGTGGAVTIRGGDATGGAGTRTGGALTLRPGSGATATGVLDIQTGSSTSRIKVNGTGIGHYNVTPTAQSADMGALTDSTGGTADNTVADVGAVFSQSTLNNNFADLAAKINSIRTLLRAQGFMA
jgi:hypothetical protein